MARSTGSRRWPIRLSLLGIAVGTMLLLGLGAARAWAPTRVRTRADGAWQMLVDWLWPTRWAWALAAALALMALFTPIARRRWPGVAQRVSAAIGLFVGLIVLASLATMSPAGAGLLALGIVVALVLGLVLMVPRWLAPPVPTEHLPPPDKHRDRLEVTDARTKLRNDLRTTILQAIVGLAVLAGAVLGFQQLTEDRQQATATRQLTLQGQASERFTRAVDQLGNTRREVQLGGIYGLEQIAQQAPDNRLPVTEVLVAYVHRRVPRPAKPRPDTDMFEELRVRAPDVQAALTVLGRRQIAPTDPRLDLTALDLRGADLRGLNFSQADLSLADLVGADLRGADLQNGLFLEANLGGGPHRRAS
jgi:uncharacterized protein YjbI with pentapeptide repeats